MTCAASTAASMPAPTWPTPRWSGSLTLLVQFAFFGPARQPGAIDFTHHILADYLAGRYAVRLLRSVTGRPARPARRARAALAEATRPISAFRQAIGTAPFAAGSLFHRTIAREIAQDAALRALVQLCTAPTPVAPTWRPR